MAVGGCIDPAFVIQLAPYAGAPAVTLDLIVAIDYEYCVDRVIALIGRGRRRFVKASG